MTVLFLAILLIIPSIAYADAGLPMIALGYPFVAALLLPVIFIESWIFQRKTGVGFKKNILAISVANCCSTLLGYPLAWLLQVMVQLGLSWIFMKLGVRPDSSFVDNPVVGALGFALASAWLPPLEGSLWWMVPAAGIVGLIPAYFISIYSENWIAEKLLRKSAPELEKSEVKKAVIRANLGSYAFLAAVILAILLKNYLSLKPTN